MQKNPTSKLMTILLGLFGLAALIYGIVFLLEDTSDYVEVTASVVSSAYASTDDYGNESYNVTIVYPVNGVDTTDIISSSQEYAAGEQMTVYYDPEDPGHVFSSRGESTCLGGIGVIFGLFCLGSLGWGWLQRRRAASSSVPHGTDTADAALMAAQPDAPPAAPTQEPPAG